MRQNLIRYLPDILKRNMEFQIIMKAQGNGLVKAWDAAQAVFDDQFISTADEYGIARYEDILGLHPSSTDTLEERRAAVLMAWMGNVPHSMQTIQAICDAWHNGWIDARYEPGVVVLDFLEKSGYLIPPDIKKLKNRIDQVKPANLDYHYAVAPATRPIVAVGYVVSMFVTTSATVRSPVPEPHRAVATGYVSSAAIDADVVVSIHVPTDGGDQ